MEDIRLDSVKAWKTTAGILTSGAYIILEVEDNGRGMDAATIEHVFEPFFSTKFTGRGLGLAAVMGIARGVRGGLQVASEPGTGSVFRVAIPAVSPSRPRLP